MSNYYNEIDPFAAAMLRNLIAAGHIAPGIVDERSIEDVRPDELVGYTQCHFFAGVGVWSLALRAAGWPDERPVWTGSCPCQPFSAAGKGDGFDDERHLWPAFQHLIAQCRPTNIFGEQVASKAVDPWIDLVHADLEALGYAFGSVPFPSAGVGAPHIRDRNYWVANADGRIGRQGRTDIRGWLDGSDAQSWARLGGGGVFDRLDDTDDTRPQGHAGHDSATGRQGPAGSVAATGLYGGLADVQGIGHQGQPIRAERGLQALRTEDFGCTGGLEHPGHDHDAGEVNTAGAGKQEADGPADFTGGSGLSLSPGPGPTNGHWGAADWLLCRDGKWRPVEPGTFPLAHGAPARVGRLRAYGNAINAKAAQAFISSVMEVA